MNEIQAVKTAKIEEVKKNSKKGFTLVELVVVIAILAVLAAIAIPVVSSTIASSQRSAALSDAQTLELALKEAHAQIIAKDTSVYQASATVKDVVDKKSLQSIGLGTAADTRTIGGTQYTLSWDANDDKCYWLDSSGKNLDSSITPGGSSQAAILTSDGVSGNEALNQARVEETGLNIPSLQEVTKIDGKWAIIFDYIEGKTLAQLMEENPEKTDEYLELFVNLQMEVLSKKAPLLNKLKDKMQRKISETGLDATTRYELSTRLNGMPKHTKVCHGDFNPSNIIITADGTPYILDWSHATQGNGSADAARTYLLFKLNKQDELAEKYIKLFCDKTDTARQYVQEWLPIVAASQSVKGKEEEREFLLSWVNVCDYQ